MIQFFNTERGVYILLTLTAILWGGNAVAAKYTVGELSPVTTAFLRFAAVSVILILLAFYIEGRKCLPRREQLPGIIALGITGIALFNFLIYSGVKLSTATNMSLLNAVGPVTTACLAALLLNERLTFRQLAGVAISFFGVIVVVANGSLAVLTGLSFNIGDIMLALAQVSWAVYSVIGRKVMRTMSALAATAWASAVGALILFAIARMEGFNGAIALSFFGWVSMAYMVLGSGCLAFFWWNHGVSVLGPHRAAIFMNIVPVAGTILAVLLVNEAVSWQQIAGAMLIISGVYLTTQNSG
ncbi:DMT family transporter [Sporolituus thermophilus]|uniref:Threonine/homoserine efflux transporter RhtA n=1 Tax=Sporolituus thermophilus DSM 23256 TaxID=1123285 RepID=A0A1G7IPE0_9FIRM|nr:DMT family transporter [Sporolituus thermophilus]SDF14414.1 Threonine/homoserine efflux transporter RhtA [Sporolituus thermophilus DSM 23256]